LYGLTLLLLLSPFSLRTASVEQLAVAKQGIKESRILNVKTDGMYSNHWPLKRKSHSNNATQRRRGDCS
jgi:hypothetical protein